MQFSMASPMVCFSYCATAMSRLCRASSTPAWLGRLVLFTQQSNYPNIACTLSGDASTVKSAVIHLAFPPIVEQQDRAGWMARRVRSSETPKPSFVNRETVQESCESTEVTTK